MCRSLMFLTTLSRQREVNDGEGKRTKLPAGVVVCRPKKNRKKESERGRTTSEERTQGAKDQPDRCGVWNSTTSEDAVLE